MLNRRAQDYIERYANFAQVQSSVSDFKLIFGIMDAPQVDENGHPLVPPSADTHTAIFMSPQQIKMLVPILASHLKEYEKQLGTIVVQIPKVTIPPAGMKV